MQGFIGAKSLQRFALGQPIRPRVIECSRT